MSYTQRYTTPTGKTVLMYHANWVNYGRNFQVKDLPIDYIPDIAYAFFNLKNGPNGWEIVTGDSWADFDKRYTGDQSVAPPDSWNDSDSSFFGLFGQFMKLKKAGKKFNLQLSVGGWTWSAHFSTAVATAKDRESFANSLIDLFKKYPIFNGISLDWEYLSDDGVNYGNGGNAVSPNDANNFIEFLKLLRGKFNSNGMSHYHISFCVVAAPEKAKFPIEQVHPLIDELHIMTYDFHDGNWGETKSAHQTNLRKSSHGVYSCEEAVDFYLSRGVPSTKIFIGAAFYSRGFANTDGIGKSASGGSTDMSWEKGVVDYKALPQPGAQEFWDDEAKATYSYDPVKRVLNSYDSVRSIQEKCKYVWEKNLAGIIVWESSSDFPIDHPRSLTKALYDGLVKGTPVVSPSQPQPQPVPVPSPQPLRPPTVQPVPQPSPAPVPAPQPPTVQPTPVPQSPSTTIPQSPSTTIPEWKPNVSYTTGTQVVFNGKIYACLQAHFSLPGWEPTIPALWSLRGNYTPPAPPIQPPPTVQPPVVPTPPPQPTPQPPTVQPPTTPSTPAPVPAPPVNGFQKLTITCDINFATGEIKNGKFNL